MKPIAHAPTHTHTHIEITLLYINISYRIIYRKHMINDICIPTLEMCFSPATCAYWSSIQRPPSSTTRQDIALNGKPVSVFCAVNTFFSSTKSFIIVYIVIVWIWVFEYVRIYHTQIRSIVHTCLWHMCTIISLVHIK